MRKAHTERISKGKCDVKLTVPYNALLHSLDRMGNSVLNLSDSVSKREIFKDFLSLDEE